VVALAAIAAGFGAYFAQGDTQPGSADQAAAPSAAPASPPANATPETTVAAPTPAAPPPAAKTPAPATASSTTAKPSGKVAVVPAETPPLEKTPALPAASPTTVRETQASQLLVVARAKLANSLTEQALADLRQIILDFPGTRTAAEASFLAGEVYEKAGRNDDALAAYVEFESRFGNDRRAADAKLRRSAILARQRQPKAQAMALQLLNDVARDYPGSPQAQSALQTKLRIETDRDNLRAIDPVTKIDGPAYVATLRTIIEQFPDAPQAMIARNRLALAFADLNRWPDAAAVLEEMAAKNENPNETYFRLAEIYERRLKNRPKAMENYAKVPSTSTRYNDAQRRLKGRD
jgi:TolA-binding protein